MTDKPASYDKIEGTEKSEGRPLRHSVEIAITGFDRRLHTSDFDELPDVTVTYLRKVSIKTGLADVYRLEVTGPPAYYTNIELMLGAIIANNAPGKRAWYQQALAVRHRHSS